MARGEYRGPTHRGQVERAEMGRSTLNLQLCLGKRWLGGQIESSDKRFRKLAPRVQHNRLKRCETPRYDWRKMLIGTYPSLPV